MKFNGAATTDYGRIYGISLDESGCRAAVYCGETLYYAKDGIIYGPGGRNVRLGDLTVNQMSYSPADGSIAVATDKGLYLVDGATLAVKGSVQETSEIKFVS